MRVWQIDEFAREIESVEIMVQETKVALHSLGAVHDVLGGQRGVEMERQFHEQAVLALKCVFVSSIFPSFITSEKTQERSYSASRRWG